MKKVTLFLCVALAVHAFSAEQICAPNFEVIGLNEDFGKSSIKVLQGKMEIKMHLRQLVVPSSADSVSATDSDVHQATWARSKGCQYLLQTTLTRLGETVQVSARLMDVNANGYVFKKAYNANTPEDLHPVFQQLGNTLQDAKFTSIETIYDVTNSDAKALTKKKTSSYWQGSVGVGYYSDFEDLYNLGFAYSWDNRTIMAEIFGNFRFNSMAGIYDFGIRALYPFSDHNNSFYLGGGAGFAVASGVSECYDDYYYDSYNNYSSYDDYCENKSGGSIMFEALAGYLVGRTSNLIFRFEAQGTVLPNIKSIGGGGRLILQIAD